MALRVTVYDGAGVIGGNKILVEADGANVFLDFGTTFATRGEYFEEYLKPRAVRGLLDMVSTALLPALGGIYRSDLFLSDGSVEAWLEQSPAYRHLAVDGVLLSHAHIDHSGYLSFLRPDIPVYSSSMTAVIAKAMQDSAMGDFEKEVCYISPREEKNGLLQTKPWQSTPLEARPFRIVDDTITPEAARFWVNGPSTRRLNVPPLTAADRVGSLPLKRFDVDHSIFGASAFALQVGQRWLVYTGDLRLHGERADSTRGFLDAVTRLERRPFVLICEGTHIESLESTGEDVVKENCLKAVQETKELVIADFGPRNIDRLLSFLSIAKETGRRLAVLAKDAYLLEAMAAVDPTIPTPATEKALYVYVDAKGRLDKWESNLLNANQTKIVKAGEVTKNQDMYILCLSFWDVNELVDLLPKAGSSYIYSSSEAYNEEQAMDMQRLRQWLELFGVRFVGNEDDVRYHASGHASGADIANIVRGIRPEVLIPVHTQQPSWFAENFGREIRVILPEAGKPISI